MELYRTCDKTLYSCQQMSKSQSDIIQDQGEQIDLQAKRISELQKNEGGLLGNTLMWTAIGIATGMIAGAILVR